MLSWDVDNEPISNTTLTGFNETYCVTNSSRWPNRQVDKARPRPGWTRLLTHCAATKLIVALLLVEFTSGGQLDRAFQGLDVH